MKQPKIRIEEYGAGHFAIWTDDAGAVADIAIPLSLDAATTLRLIAQVIRREAERIERDGAPMIKQEGKDGVRVDGWLV